MTNRRIILISTSIFIVIYALLNIFWGNVMPYGNFDGTLYVRIAENPYEVIFVKGLSSYHIQRIFPSIIIYLMYKSLWIDPNPQNITILFQVYNILLLLGVIWFWDKIAKFFDFNNQLLLLGIIFSVFNFGVLNSAFYYPYLTDYTALFLSYWLLFGYLKNRTLEIIIATLIGAFTWPSFIFFGLIFILFPYTNSPVSNLIKWDKDSRFHFLHYLLPMPFLLIALYRIYMMYSTNLPLVDMQIEDRYVIQNLSILSAFLNYGLLAYMLYFLIPDIKNIFPYISNILKFLKWKNIVIAISVFLISNILVSMLAFSEEVPFGIKSILYNLSVLPAIKPLFMPVEAITYFGPLFIFLFLFFAPLSKVILKMNPAIYISFALFLLLKQIPESRTTINYHSFLVLIVCISLKDKVISNSFVVIVLLISLLFSKIYLPIDRIINELDEIIEFPSQLYFMNTYFMSNLSYYIILPPVIICTYLIYKTMGSAKIKTL